MITAGVFCLFSGNRFKEAFPLLVVLYGVFQVLLGYRKLQRMVDALRMKAVSNRFSPGEACVMALEAGADMLLLPGDFTDAYHAVVKAVEEGRIAEERINESVKRILLLKNKYGLLKR